MPFPGGAIVLSFKHENTIGYLKKKRKHERTNSGFFLEDGRFDRRILELRETTEEGGSVNAWLHFFLMGVADTTNRRSTRPPGSSNYSRMTVNVLRWRAIGWFGAVRPRSVSAKSLSDGQPARPADGPL